MTVELFVRSWCSPPRDASLSVVTQFDGRLVTDVDGRRAPVTIRGRPAFAVLTACVSGDS